VTRANANLDATVYAQAMRRGDSEQDALRAQIDVVQLAVVGSRGENALWNVSEARAA
jgi:hypothetical protein